MLNLPLAVKRPQRGEPVKELRIRLVPKVYSLHWQLYSPPGIYPQVAAGSTAAHLVGYAYPLSSATTADYNRSLH